MVGGGMWGGGRAAAAGALALARGGGPPAPWAPPAYNSSVAAALRRFPGCTSGECPRPGGSDPYAGPPFEAPSGRVCGLAFLGGGCSEYRLATFDSAAAALSAGHRVTHETPCGTCSDLTSLAAYVEHTDLTTPVRRCAARAAVLGWSAGMRCLGSLGFPEPCAETWLYNARNTRRKCGLVCLAAWARGWPNNRPDGSLNACLQCDEDQSGPGFKWAAGRTRRNSGLLSAIARPGGEVAHVVHDYWQLCGRAGGPGE